MGSHMKTTIDIARNLLEGARSRARKEHRTLRELVEEALRRHLGRGESPKAFKLTRHAFKGKGLREGLEEGDWERVRDLIYRT